MSNVIQPAPDSTLRTPQSALASPPARLMEDILCSYEQRINGVQALFDTTRLVLADYQDSAEEAHQEQSLLHTQLRETLSRNEHLRNKDYERMMQPIVEPRRARENEIRKLFNQFLAEQQRLAADLKARYGQIRLQLAQGDPRKILALLQAVKQLLREQDRKKEEFAARLKQVQQERQELVAMVKQLLAKGNALRIRDFKEILGRILDQRRERIVGKLSRRLGVHEMLSQFKQQRVKEKQDHSTLVVAAPAGDLRLKEALESLPWTKNLLGGEQTNKEEHRNASVMRAGCHSRPDRESRKINAGFPLSRE